MTRYAFKALPTNQRTLPHEDEDEFKDDRYVDEHEEKHDDDDEMIVILPNSTSLSIYIRFTRQMFSTLIKYHFPVLRMSLRMRMRMSLRMIGMLMIIKRNMMMMMMK